MKKTITKSLSLKKCAVLVLACALLTGALAGCGTDAKEPSASAEKSATKAVSGDTTQYSRTVFAMDTVMNITSYGGSEELLDDVEARILELESLFSTTDENSDIYKINENGGGDASPDTLSLASFALDICDKTGGALDISIYPIVREWGFTTNDFKVPEDSVIKELLKHVDYTKVALDEDKGTITLDEDMMIDLGSVAKGYTGDQIIEILRAAGVQSALLDLGGNIQTLGSKTDGEDWRVAIQDPQNADSDNYLGVLAVSDKAVITSGGYERYFTGDDGKIYWHIMDPSTGRPAQNGLISVTIVGAKGVYCDSLSTSLFIMGRDDAIAFWKKYQDFDMILVSDDGRVDVTEGIYDKFSLMNEDDYHVNEVSA